MEQHIPLKDEQKVFLANGIFRAVTQDLPEIIYENNLPTSVGSGLFRWNFINRNLSAELGGDFELSFQKRGAWRFLLLRDRETNLSFSVMTEQNLKRLQRNPPLSTHYLEALISDNANREPIERQMCLFETFPEKDVYMLFELKNQLFSEFTGIVDEHVLILFDYSYTGVTSVRAVLLTKNLEVAVSDDWTKHMTSTYIPAESILAATLSEDDELLATLKADDNHEMAEIIELSKSTFEVNIE